MGGRRHPMEPKDSPPRVPAALVAISSDDDGWDPSLELVRRAKVKEAGGSLGLEVGSRSMPPSPLSARNSIGGVEGKKKRVRIRGKKWKKLKDAGLPITTNISPNMKTTDGALGKIGVNEMSHDFIDLDSSPVLLKGMDLDGIEMVDNVVESESIGGNGVADNSVFRRLLRGPRYFDPPELHSQTCFNCGEEGHIMAACPSEKRKKPCFVCGNYGHSARHCTQGQDCYLCRKIGHKAKDCPQKNENNSASDKLCLRCGECGHDMSSCGNDYPPEDVKVIQCYVCNKYGHFGCAQFDAGPKNISCYNCGQSGHSGPGCAKSRSDIGGLSTPSSIMVCYNCGEEGHFARGCSNSVKSTLRQRDQAFVLSMQSALRQRNHSSPRGRYLRECSYAERRALSVPRNIGLSSARGRHQDEGKHGRRSSKSKYEADNPTNYVGAATSKRKFDNGHLHSPANSGNNRYETPPGCHVDSRSPVKTQKVYEGSSSSHGVVNRSHRGFTASRLSNNVRQDYHHNFTPARSSGVAKRQSRHDYY